VECLYVLLVASIRRLSRVGALWDCVPRVYGGGGCVGDGAPLGAVPVLSVSWCEEVSLGGILISIIVWSVVCVSVLWFVSVESAPR